MECILYTFYMSCCLTDKMQSYITFPIMFYCHSLINFKIFKVQQYKSEGTFSSTKYT